MTCSNRFCRVLKAAGQADAAIIKGAKISLLSTEGKIISAIMNNPKCRVKDIPSLAGVSHRSAFDCLVKLSELGIVQKYKDPDDARSRLINVSIDRMCQVICRNIPESVAFS